MQNPLFLREGVSTVFLIVEVVIYEKNVTINGVLLFMQVNVGKAHEGRV